MIGPSEQPGQRPTIDRVIKLRGRPLPIDLEFQPSELTAIFSAAGLPAGRCFGSKSRYQQSHPRGIFIPNANVFCRRHGKIWWGDLDIRRDQPALEKAARQLRCRLYVLSEMDGRFENATQPFETVIHRAQWHTGGATRIPGMAAYLRRSGLSLAQLAMLTKIRRFRFTRRQRPEIALEAYRRLLRLPRRFGSGGSGRPTVGGVRPLPIAAARNTRECSRRKMGGTT